MAFPFLLSLFFKGLRRSLDSEAFLSDLMHMMRLLGIRRAQHRVKFTDVEFFSQFNLTNFKSIPVL